MVIFHSYVSLPEGNMAVKFRKKCGDFNGTTQPLRLLGIFQPCLIARGYRKVKPMIQDGYSRTSNAAIAVPSKVAWSQCSFHQCSEAAVIPLPSGKHTKNYGKNPPFSMGKSTINIFKWPFSIAILLNNQRVFSLKGINQLDPPRLCDPTSRAVAPVASFSGSCESIEA